MSSGGDGQCVYLISKSDLLDAELVVQKARKQVTVLLPWGLIGSYNAMNSPTFW